MIIETPYAKSDTVTMKTIAGEEIVARFEEETSTHVTVKNPMTIMQSAQGFGLGPFSITANPKSTFKLNKTAILCIVKTDGEMAKQYVQSSTGIMV